MANLYLFELSERNGHRVEHQGTVEVVDASESQASERAWRELAVHMPELLEDGEVKLRARVLSEKEGEPVSPYAFDVVLTVECREVAMETAVYRMRPVR